MRITMNHLMITLLSLGGSKLMLREKFVEKYNLGSLLDARGVKWRDSIDV